MGTFLFELLDQKLFERRINELRLILANSYFFVWYEAFFVQTNLYPLHHDPLQCISVKNLLFFLYYLGHCLHYNGSQLYYRISRNHNYLKEIIIWLNFSSTKNMVREYRHLIFEYRALAIG